MRRMILASLLLVACTGCVAPLMRSTLAGPPTPAQMAELWEKPNDLTDRNLFDGPWGKALAPNPTAAYAYVSEKTVGFSPGFAVTDEQGMEWSVKQGPEAQVEVVSSRVLWAVGYHQPPVYYLPRWDMSGGPSQLRLQAEGRFRPKGTVLKDRGEWSWQENPFIGTRPYNGLRVLMLLLNQTDLKSSNNTLYEVSDASDVRSAAQRWYVVRDIGAALGETGSWEPLRNDLPLFEKNRFINGVIDGAVHFNYRGLHQELADHISPEDVRWMCDLLAQLTMEQWRDAFRAGGYEAELSEGFIARIKEKIAEGQALAPSVAAVASEPRQSSPTLDLRQGGGVKPVASDHAMLQKYVWSTLGFEGARDATLSANLDQWREGPPVWGLGAAGYAKRWASRYAESAIGDTATYTVAHLLHHDPSFTRCECPGVGRRLLHAVDAPFMARTRDGRRVPSPATLAGMLTGRIVSTSTWYPASHGARDGLQRAGTSLATKIVVNVFREFWPSRSK